LTAETIPQDCGYILVRTWSTADSCGNIASASQTITVVDTVAPTVVTGVAAELTLECDQPEPVDMPVFADNCDANITVTSVSGINNVSGCGWDVEKSWTATDNCGNSTTVSQLIHFVDTTAPTLSGAPMDATVDCSSVPAAEVLTATDNCDENVVVAFTELIGDGCPYTITRTWIATDACGNSSSHIQVLTVEDNEAPVLVGVPMDYSADCGTAPDVAVVTATDNCDANVVVTYDETVNGSVCPLTITRTWTATDACGNIASASQDILIDDSIAPELVGVP